VRLKTFLKENSLYNHINKKTCWKTTSGSCIELIISNRKLSLINYTGTLETRLSDHHLLIYTKQRDLVVNMNTQAKKGLSSLTN